MKKIKTDVLIIGGGLAGCWAAMAALELTDDVLLVDKSMVGRSGCSTFAAGVMLAPISSDNLDEWREEIVKRGEFMSDQDWVEVLLEEQMARLTQMNAWGFPFEKEPDGSFSRMVGRGHIKTRMLMFHGHHLMNEMRKQVLGKGIRLMERIMVTDILTDNSGPRPRLCGAIGFHTRQGEWLAINAKAVIICAGHIGTRLGGRYVDNISGDGPAMAYRAGVTLCDMEFTTQCNITIWRRQYEAAGINMIQGNGAYIINAKGERFMEKYDPLLKERSKTYTLGAAFTKETLEGRGPIYVDMRPIKPEVFERFNRVIPKTMQVFKAAGIDPGREPIECAPSTQSPRTDSGEGGIKVDLSCCTNFPGLFAAGSSTKILPHGTYAVGGINLAYCCVAGYRAGRQAAEFAAKSGFNPLPGDHPLKEKVSRLPAQGRDAEELIKMIKMATVPARYSYFKHARRIQQTLARLAELEEEYLPELGAADAHHLVKALEVRNYLTCARLTYQAALIREESRGSHFREEFPYRDDRHWLKRITVRREADEDKLDLEPIPIAGYPVRPKRLDPIPYPVQYFFEG